MDIPVEAGESDMSKYGHTEAVKVTFDPRVITYAQLLDKFFKDHSPNSSNASGLIITTVWFKNKLQKELISEKVGLETNNRGKSSELSSHR